MDPESDDDFDETTLWEIASLLNSNDVPSKMSLLPRANVAIEDYESDDSGSEESFTQKARTQPLTMTLPIQPLEIRETPRSSLQVSSSNMWTPPARVVERPSTGLFSKPSSVIRTTNAAPAAAQMLKAPRKASRDLPVLTSDSLWASAKALRQGIIWITKKESPRKMQEVQVSAMMWSPTEKTVEVASKGLFNISIPRALYRTTEAAPAALSMICKSRKSELPLEALTSTKLWHQAHKLDIERDWISESSIRPQTPSIYSESSSRASSPVSDSSSVKSTSTKASSVWGFSAIPTWWDQKRSKNSSPSPPAEDAKSVSKIPLRQPSKPLASVRESRVLASRDMFEAKSPITLEKKLGMKFRRQTISKAAKPSHQAMRQKHRPNGTFQADWDEALSEAIAASRTKPTLKSIFSKSKTSQPVIIQAVIKQPKLPKLTRPIASKADWCSALSEAISRSQPRMQRPQCNPEMWEAALASAIELSVIPEATISPTYDASVMHPVFFTKRLVSNAIGIHPAAIGYVSKNYDASVSHPVFFTERLVSNVIDVHPAALGYVFKNYDAAAMHPVFFTESLVSDVADIHPAAIGHFTVKRPITSFMWSSEPSVAASKAGLLWTNNSAALRKSSTSMTASSTLVRKPLPVRSLDLPVLKSTSLWAPSTTISAGQNWLVAVKPPVSKPVASQTWTLRASSPVEIQNSGMWVAKSDTAAILPDMFANIKHDRARASSPRSEILPTLTSTSLFVKTASLPTDIHWLRIVSKSTKADKPTMTTTWKAPATPEPRSQLGMWNAAAQQPAASPDLFAHLQHDTIRATPSRSVSVALPVLNTSKLFEVAVTRQSTPDWLHQTSKPVKSMTWAPPAPAELQSEIGMWTATTKQSSASPDLFAHLNVTHARAIPSRSAALPLLSSSALFEITATENPNTHWLHQTSKTARSMTWNAPSVQTPRHETAMWTSPTKSTAFSPDLFAHIKSDNFRASAPRPATLPKLSSTTLFAVTKSTSEPTHWLHKTSKTAAVTTRNRSTTWTAKTSAAIKSKAPKELSSTMWIAQPIIPRSLPSPMLFANTHTEPWTRPKRSDSAVSGIESAELWHSSRDVAQSPKNWLAGSGSTKVEFRY